MPRFLGPYVGALMTTGFGLGWWMTGTLLAVATLVGSAWLPEAAHYAVPGFGSSVVLWVTSGWVSATIRDPADRETVTA